MEAEPSAHALVAAGLSRHQAGDLAQAEALYRAALAAEAGSLNALQLLGALTCATGRPAEAVALLRQAVVALGGVEAAPHAILYNNLGNALQALGRAREAIACYRRGIDLAPATGELHANLGNALFSLDDPITAAQSYDAAIRLDATQGEKIAAAVRALPPDRRAQRAVPLFERLAGLRPGDALVWRELGRAQFAAGDMAAASASFGRVLELEPGDGDARYALARLHHQRGDHAAAERGYLAALRATPRSINALYNLGVLLQQDLDRPAEAIALFEGVLAIMPDHVDAHFGCAAAAESTRQTRRALDAYRRVIELKPELALAHYRLGKLLGEDGRDDAAIRALERASALAPDDARCHLELGNIRQRQARGGDARIHYRRALALAPVIARKAERAAAFSVLAIFAPGTANTPTDFLFARCGYDVNFLLYLPDIEYDIALLRRSGDVAINLISDVDQGREVLPAVASLLDRLTKPVINHPNRILRTGRETSAALLGGIPDCVVPPARRRDAATLLAHDFLNRPDAPRLPCLLRPAGTHGGDAFEKIERAKDIADLVSAHPGAEFYETAYADYRSPDGFYRKYRFFFIGEAILPYHLAIGDTWKVHHAHTEMAGHQWMKQEEAAFLEHPWQVFRPAHVAALEAIRARVGLDFFGIDCGIDGGGRMIVFETNAAMLVHNFNPEFPYKAPYVAKVKSAWDALLTRTATGARW